MRDISINSNLNPLTELTSSSTSTEFKDILPRNISQMITKTVNQHKNSHKLCDETRYPVVNLMESQWKLRQQHDQNSEFPNGGKAIVEQILASAERNPKEQE